MVFHLQCVVFYNIPCTWAHLKTPGHVYIPHTLRWPHIKIALAATRQWQKGTCRPSTHCRPPFSQFLPLTEAGAGQDNGNVGGVAVGGKRNRPWLTAWHELDCSRRCCSLLCFTPRSLMLAHYFRFSRTAGGQVGGPKRKKSKGKCKWLRPLKQTNRKGLTVDLGLVRSK